MGLPHLDFRVPESGWFKAALDRVHVGSMVSATGSLTLPYKIAVVAVMALVACGTLVTFGTAGAETAASTSDNAAALPGTDEASPQVQGQVLPPSQSLLTSQDLLSTLNLTDYSPGETKVAGLDDDDESDDSDDSDEDKKKAKPKSSSPSPKPSTGGGGGDTNSDGDDGSDSEPQEPVEGPKHKQWEADMAAYEDAHDEWEEQKETYDNCVHDLPLTPRLCDDKKPDDEPQKPQEPPYTS